MKTKKGIKIFAVVAAFCLSVGCALMFGGAFNKVHAADETTASTFEMIQGAYVRVSENTGLRFVVKMDKTLAAKVKTNDDYTLKFLISPKYYFDKITDGEYVNLEKKVEITVDKEKIYDGEGENDGYSFANGVIANIKEQNRTIEFCAVAYYTENGKNVYAAMPQNNERSFYYVTNKAFISGADGVAENILSLNAYSWYGEEAAPISVATEEEYNNLVSVIKAGNLDLTKKTVARAYDENSHYTFKEWKADENGVKIPEFTAEAHSAGVWEMTETGRTGKCTCGKEMISAVENVPATKITLYTMASFADKDYAVSADYAPSVTVNGKATDVTVSVNGEAAVYNAETKKINAVKAGTVTVNVNYTVADQQVAKSFEVEVVKPVLTIDSAVSYFSAIDGKDPSVDMFEYFDGKEFTAKQTYGGQENALTADSANKALLGAVTESKKATVCSITLECAEYVVVYSKVTAYTKVITDYTDFEDMRLTADKKTIEGYFILNADIDLTNADIDGDGAVTNYDTFYRYYDPKAKASTDMLTAVTDTNAGYGFVGVFDGNGHKINGFRSGNSYGFFGTVSGKSLDDMTEIKNVAFTNILAGESSWTKGRVLAEYAAFVKVENVYMSFNVTENWTKNYAIFGCNETVYFRFNKMIIEMSKTYESGAAGAETMAVGVFGSVATTKWAAESQNVWHYKMIAVYNNMYFIAPPTASGRVLPLNQSTALTVYAANDFADIEENASVSLNETTLNPEVNASGSMKLYHWANAYRYDNYEKMKEKTAKVGNWDISSGKPVWVA